MSGEKQHVSEILQHAMAAYERGRALAETKPKLADDAFIEATDLLGEVRDHIGFNKGVAELLSQLLIQHASVVATLDPARAVDVIDHAITVNKTLAQSYPDQHVYRVVVAMLLPRKASALSDIDAAKANTAFDQAGLAFERLVTLYPDDPHIADQYSKALSGRAMLLVKTDPQQAADLFSESISLLEQVMTADPDNFQNIRDLGVRLSRQAACMERIGATGVEQVHDRAIAELTRITELDANDFVVLNALATSLLTRSRDLTESNPTEAARLRERCALTLGIMNALKPGNTKLMEAQAATLLYAAALTREHDPLKAMHLYGQAADVIRANIAAGHDLPEEHIFLGSALRSVAEIQGATTDTAAALVTIVEAKAAIEPHIHEHHPDLADALRQLAIATSVHADLLQEQGNYAEALPLHNTVVELVNRIVDNGGLEISDINLLRSTDEAIQAIDKAVAGGTDPTDSAP